MIAKTSHDATWEILLILRGTRRSRTGRLFASEQVSVEFGKGTTTNAGGGMCVLQVILSYNHTTAVLIVCNMLLSSHQHNSTICSKYVHFYPIILQVGKKVPSKFLLCLVFRIYRWGSGGKGVPRLILVLFLVLRGRVSITTSEKNVRVFNSLRVKPVRDLIWPGFRG